MIVKFNGNGTFRIAQLTDIHLNHYPFDDNDNKILTDIERTVKKLQPDLLMITGDMVNTYQNTEEKSIFRAFFEFLNRFDIPKSVTYGNHDSENQLNRHHLEALFEEIVKKKVDRKREEIIVERSNYTIEILNSTGTSKQQVLYVMDTGMVAPGIESKNDWVYPEQVEWFSKTAENYKGYKNNLLFIHIPLPEYISAKENLVSGELREPGKLISSSKINTGLFSQLYFSKQIHGIFCGHNHLNNAELLYEGIHLYYGMFSGKEEKAVDFRGIRCIDLMEFGEKIGSENIFYNDVD